MKKGLDLAIYIIGGVILILLVATLAGGTNDIFDDVPILKDTINAYRTTCDIQLETTVLSTPYIYTGEGVNCVTEKIALCAGQSNIMGLFGFEGKIEGSISKEGVILDTDTIGFDINRAERQKKTLAFCSNDKPVAVKFTVTDKKGSIYDEIYVELGG